LILNGGIDSDRFSCHRVELIQPPELILLEDKLDSI